MKKDKQKPFFYKVIAAELAVVVMEIPEGQHKAWLYQFVKDLVSGNGTSDYSTRLIHEAAEFSAKKSNSGKKGMKSRWLDKIADDNTAITNDNTAITHPTIAVTRSSSSNRSIKEEPKNLSSSEDEVEEYLVSRKGRKLIGKRLEAFNRFWIVFNYKVGKAEAIDAWLDIHTMNESLVSLILTGAAAEASRREALRQSGKTPKMAQGWLSGRRWEDEISLSVTKKEDWESAK